MAEEKPLDPTAQRIQQAHKDGNRPQASELTAIGATAVGCYVVALLGTELLSLPMQMLKFAAYQIRFVRQVTQDDVVESYFHQIQPLLHLLYLSVAAVFISVGIAALGLARATNSIGISAVTMRWSRLNPQKYFAKVCSPRKR